VDPSLRLREEEPSQALREEELLFLDTMQPASLHGIGVVDEAVDGDAGQ